ncbi:MAG TPA: ACT domain-containing protein, partial [Verrucomicrobiae bacterium]|nr:ACT domain-containing protein [Verrucomicrobiae bacterium]
LIITIVARDRPGLVESLAAAITRQGGNWLESRMSRLGGQFAGILRVTVPPSNREKLLSDFKTLEAQGMRIATLDDQAPVAPSASARFAEFTIVGHDRPGIVRQISQAFARADINVEDLSTECTSAPMSGEMLFHAHAKLQIPATCDFSAVRFELEKIAADLMVDLTFTELGTPHH